MQWCVRWLEKSHDSSKSSKRLMDFWPKFKDTAIYLKHTHTKQTVSCTELGV